MVVITVLGEEFRLLIYKNEVHIERKNAIGAWSPYCKLNDEEFNGLFDDCMRVTSLLEEGNTDEADKLRGTIMSYLDAASVEMTGEANI